MSVNERIKEDDRLEVEELLASTEDKNQSEHGDNDTQAQSTEVPLLKYRGQTPIIADRTTPASKKIKRGSTVLSPLTEISGESDLHITIKDSIEKSKKNVLPSILDTLRKELRSTINENVDNKNKNLESKSKGKLLFESEKANSKTLSQNLTSPTKDEET